MTIEILRNKILTIVNEFPIKKSFFLVPEQMVQIMRIVMWT